MSGALECTVHDLAQRIDDLRDDIGGDGGLRERLTRLESGMAAHEIADTTRHTDVCARVDGTRADVAALRALVEQDVRRPGVLQAAIGLAQTTVQTGGRTFLILLGLTGLAAVGGAAAVDAAVRGQGSLVMRAFGGDEPAALPPTPPAPVGVAP